MPWARKTSLPSSTASGHMEPSADFTLHFLADHPGPRRLDLRRPMIAFHAVKIVPRAGLG